MSEDPQNHAAAEYMNGPVGVVLAGAGARGAYEAGMLAAFLPTLARCGLRPNIFIGTSAGSINAALFASLAHLPAEQAAREAVSRWRQIRKPMVMRPAWQTLPMFALRYLAALSGIRGQLTSLFDTGPLLASLGQETLIDWAQLHQNALAEQPSVAAVAVVTTEMGSNRTKVWVECPDSTAEKVGFPATDDERAMDYVRTQLEARHVLASAAIPVAFPPVRLGTSQAPSWNVDGGVRLNAPLKPAITLGARKLIVVATDPARYQQPPLVPMDRPAPSVLDSADEIMHGALSDRMIEDLQELMRMNRVLAADLSRTIKSPRGREYQTVEFIFGGPASGEDVGATAALALSEALHGLGRFTNWDLSLLNFILGAGPTARPDLMSFLFFEPEFINLALQQGERHASLILQELAPEPGACPQWCTTELNRAAAMISA